MDGYQSRESQGFGGMLTGGGGDTAKDERDKSRRDFCGCSFSRGRIQARTARAPVLGEVWSPTNALQGCQANLRLLLYRICAAPSTQLKGLAPTAYEGRLERWSKRSFDKQRKEYLPQQSQPCRSSVASLQTGMISNLPQGHAARVRKSDSALQVS